MTKSEALRLLQIKEKKPNKETILKAYKKLSKKYHPDFHKNDDTFTTLFMSITEAKNYLINNSYNNSSYSKNYNENFKNEPNNKKYVNTKCYGCGINIGIDLFIYNRNKNYYCTACLNKKKETYFYNAFSKPITNIKRYKTNFLFFATTVLLVGIIEIILGFNLNFTYTDKNNNIHSLSLIDWFNMFPKHNVNIFSNSIDGILVNNFNISAYHQIILCRIGVAFTCVGIFCFIVIIFFIFLNYRKQIVKYWYKWRKKLKW